MVEILFFHVRQFDLQALAGEQTFVKIVPLVSSYERSGRAAPLEVESALGLVRLVQRQLKETAMQIGGVLLQKKIDGVIGQLVAQYVKCFGRLLDRALLDVEIAQRWLRRRSAPRTCSSVWWIWISSTST